MRLLWRNEHRIPTLCISTSGRTDAPAAGASARLLFAGKEQTDNGASFYVGKSDLTRSTRKALERVYGKPKGTAQFMRGFRDQGFDVEDLRYPPISHNSRCCRFLCSAGGGGVPGLVAVLETMLR
jgi:hypothetical protein